MADFGIGDLGDLLDQFVAERLGLRELWVVLRNDHPLARMRQIEFGALKDVALVSFRPGAETRRLIDAAATSAGFALRHVVTVGLVYTLMNLVAEGVGVAVVSARRWPPGIDARLVSRPLVKPKLTGEIGILRLRDRDLSPAAASLLSLARERLRIRPSRGRKVGR